MTYTGPSIVDYLASIGQASDFSSRSKLAQANNISGYTGTAAQNTQLLGILRTPQQPAAPAAPIATTAPVTTPPITSTTAGSSYQAPQPQQQPPAQPYVTATNAPQQPGMPQDPTQPAQQGTTAPQQQQPPQQGQPAPYTGPSIVDYLGSVGQASDFTSRAKMALQAGIQNYTGTAQQNTQLLNTLRGAPAATSGTPQGGTGSAATGGTESTTNSGFADSGTGTGTSTAEGGTATDGTPAATPYDFIESYKKVILDLGLPDIKAEFEKTQKEQADLETELSDKINDVNNDPWLSTSVRASEVTALKGKYEGRLGILTNKQQLYDSLYKQGVQQAQFLATGEYNQKHDAALLAEKQLEATKKLQELDPSTYKEIQGGLYDIKSNKWIVPPKVTSSSGASTIGDLSYTRDEINTGAARAGVSVDDFKQFSEDAANAFINNYPGITQKIKEIDQGLKDGTDPSEIEGVISSLLVPDEIKNYLVKYLKSKSTASSSTGGFFSHVLDFFTQ